MRQFFSLKTTLRWVAPFAIIIAFSGCSTQIRALGLLAATELDSLPAVNDLSYTASSTVLTDTAITPIGAGVATTGITYSISPALPAGLSFDTATGIISGTPTATVAATDYTITASNGVTTKTQTISIRTGPGFQVNSFADTSDATLGDSICATAGAVCTLRAAVQEANALGGATNRLILVPAGTVALSGAAQIPITSNLEIIGASQTTTIIDGNATVAANSSQRIFYANGVYTIAITNVTLQNAKPPDGLRGGAVYFGGGATATLSDISFLNNHVTNGDGGAVTFIDAATNYTLKKCYVANNTAGGQGGGVYIRDVTSPGLVTECTFENNTAVAQGGGLAHRVAQNQTVSKSYFVGNQSTGWNGGGIDNDSLCDNNSFINNTFFNNTAVAGGGGMYLCHNGTGPLHTVTNNTFVSNHANTRPGFGGGCGVNGSILTNSILYDNRQNGTETPDNCSGIGTNTTSGGGNIAGTDLVNCPYLTQPTDRVSTDPMLGALGANGGTTFNYVLSGGSPAIDGGVNAGCPATDQRGLPRPVNGTCDSGAYEAQ